MDNLGVIVPFYNEKTTLAESVERLLAQNIFTEIILSDDNSNDGSDEKIGRASCRERV